MALGFGGPRFSAGEDMFCWAPAGSSSPCKIHGGFPFPGWLLAKINPQGGAPRFSAILATAFAQWPKPLQPASRELGADMLPWSVGFRSLKLASSNAGYLQAFPTKSTGASILAGIPPIRVVRSNCLRLDRQLLLPVLGWGPELKNWTGQVKQITWLWNPAPRFPLGLPSNTKQKGVRRCSSQWYLHLSGTCETL